MNIIYMSVKKNPQDFYNYPPLHPKPRDKLYFVSHELNITNKECKYMCYTIPWHEQVQSKRYADHCINVA